MFGQTFYFSTIRKYVILVGTLFNDIRVVKKDSSNNEISLVRVPITYAPKDKMLARVFQDPNINRPSATMPLPMISFEMGKMEYDGTRKLHTTGRSTVKSPTANSQSIFNYQYNPVPYNVSFKVYVYAKNVEDGTKIIEQILPFFTPDWTTRVNLIPEMNIIMDIPVVLNNISYSDDYADGDMSETRKIVWTLDLTVKGYIYGPVKSSGIIKFVNIDFYIPPVPDGQLPSAVGNSNIDYKLTIQPGLDANGNPVNYSGAPNSNIPTIPYGEIQASDDYGFITQIYDYAAQQTIKEESLLYISSDSDSLLVSNTGILVDTTTTTVIINI